jgi:hypothetical protein
VKISDLPKWNPDEDGINLKVAVVSDDKTMVTTVGELLNVVGRIDTCQYCGQPTLINRACDYCGAQP